MANKIKTLNRSGLVGEWKLDGNSLDSAGTNNGANTNGIYVATDRGYQSQCWQGNGTNAYISIPNNANLSFGTGNFSVTVLFKTSRNTVQTNVGMVIAGKIKTTSNSNGWWIRMIMDGTADNGKIQLHCRGTSGGFEGFTTSSSYNDGKWHTITMVRSGTTIFGYADGQLLGSQGIASDDVTNTGSLYIGTNGTAPGTNDNFDGQIQVLRVDNIAISDEEIRNRYLEGLRYLGGQSYGSLFDGLVGYWDMNGDAIDVVGGNNGTVTGATLTTDRFGITNRAYSFDGVNDYIQKTATTWGIGDTFTINVLFNKDVNTDSKTIFAIRPATGAINIIQAETFNTNYIRVIMYSSNGTTFKDYKTTTTSLSTGVWYLLSITYSANSLKIYIDDTEQSVTKTTDGSLSLTNTSRNLTIGAETISTHFFDGNIGEFLLFNTLKTADEIKLLDRVIKTTYPYPF